MPRPRKHYYFVPNEREFSDSEPMDRVYLAESTDKVKQMLDDRFLTSDEPFSISPIAIDKDDIESIERHRKEKIFKNSKGPLLIWRATKVTNIESGAAVGTVWILSKSEELVKAWLSYTYGSDCYEKLESFSIVSRSKKNYGMFV